MAEEEKKKETAASKHIEKKAEEEKQKVTDKVNEATKEFVSDAQESQKEPRLKKQKKTPAAPANTLQGMQVTISNGGWKAVIMKFGIYFLLPFGILGLTAMVILGKISPSVVLDLLGGKNLSKKIKKDPTSGQIFVDKPSGSTTMKPDISDKEHDSLDYVSKVLKNLEKVRGI